MIMTFQIMFFTLSEESRQDKRTVRTRPLRLIIPLKFLSLLNGDASGVEVDERCMCQGVISFAVTICDKRLWDGICLSDEYFMEYSRMSEYPDEPPNASGRSQANCPAGLRPPRRGVTDPIMDEEATFPNSDPRAYFLRAFENTLHDVANRTEELLETFAAPVEAHVSSLSPAEYTC